MRSLPLLAIAVSVTFAAACASAPKGPPPATPAQMAFKAMGDNPDKKSLENFIRLHGDAPEAEPIRKQLSLMELAHAEAHWDFARLADIAESSPYPDVVTEASAAARLVASGRDPMAATPFQSYLAARSEGPLAEAANDMLAWQERAKVEVSGGVYLQLGGFLDQSVTDAVLGRFRSEGVEVNELDADAPFPTQDGNVVYRFSLLQQNEQFRLQLFTGSAVDLRAPERSVVAQILVVEGGEPQLVWGDLLVGTRGALNFPVVEKVRLASVLRVLDIAPRLTSMVRVGSRLYISHPDSIAELDISLPYLALATPGWPNDERIRRIYLRLVENGRPPGLSAGGGDVVAHGVGAWWFDVDLNEGLASKVDWSKMPTSRVRGAAFTRGIVALTGDRGTHLMHPKWATPKRIAAEPGSWIGVNGDYMLIGSKVALDLRRFEGGGRLSAATRIEPERELPGYDWIVDGAPLGGRMLLLRRSGTVSELDIRRLSAENIPLELTGPVVALDADGKSNPQRLVVTGAWGLEVLTRGKDGWSKEAQLPLRGCNDVILVGDYAHLTCGGQLVTVHLKLL